MSKLECMTQQAFQSAHVLDEAGKPAGGHSYGVGIAIDWQNGPLGRDGDRIDPNGAFVETVIAIAKERIEWYNANGYSCRENSLAVTKLEEALHWLNARTARREAEGVEGTHKGS